MHHYFGKRHIILRFNIHNRCNRCKENLLLNNITGFSFIITSEAEGNTRIHRNWTKRVKQVVCQMFDVSIREKGMIKNCGDIKTLCLSQQRHHVISRGNVLTIICINIVRLPSLQQEGIGIHEWRVQEKATFTFHTGCFRKNKWTANGWPVIKN